MHLHPLLDHFWVDVGHHHHDHVLHLVVVIICFECTQPQTFWKEQLTDCYSKQLAWEFMWGICFPSRWPNKSLKCTDDGWWFNGSYCYGRGKVWKLTMVANKYYGSWQVPEPLNLLATWEWGGFCKRKYNAIHMLCPFPMWMSGWLCA